MLLFAFGGAFMVGIGLLGLELVTTKISLAEYPTCFFVKSNSEQGEIL
jgi:hypothetical protein